MQNEQKVKDDTTIKYRLQATALLYVSGQKVSNEFYCRIESHFIQESESGDRAPKSTVSYLNPYQKKDRLFFFEEDVFKLMLFENVKYTKIFADHYYEGGKRLDKEIIDKDKIAIPVVPANSISHEEYILLCLLSVIVTKTLNIEHPRFKTINQLHHYPHEKYPRLKGISESSVRSKIKKAHKIFKLETPSFSDIAINTRTEKTLHNMIAILLDSIISGIQASFKNEDELASHLFAEGIFDQKPEIKEQAALQILLDIMNDFKFITEMNEVVSISAQ